MRRPTIAVENVSTIRRFVVLSLACLFTASGLFAMQNLGYWKLGNAGFHNLASIAVGATDSLRELLGIPPPSLSNGGLIFAKESAMTSSELLDRWNPIVEEASRRFAVSDKWIRAVMRVESGGRTVLAGDKPIVSRAGALGIMQVMPDTYAEMSTLYGLGANPFDPHDNIFAAAAYLKWLRGKYGFPEMFAAYNGGPRKLDAFLQKGQPLPKETVNYVASVSGLLGDKKRTEIALLARERQKRHLHRPVVPSPEFRTISVEGAVESAQ